MKKVDLGELQVNYEETNELQVNCASTHSKTLQKK